MPAFNSFEKITDQIISDVRAVWTNVQKAYIGWPALPPKTYPFVVIALDEGPIRQEPAAVKAFWQMPTFTITKVDVLPADKTQGVQRKQVSEANELASRLEAGIRYGDDGAGGHVAQDPVATPGPFTPVLTDDRDHVYEVSVRFSCRALEYHSSFTP